MSGQQEGPNAPGAAWTQMFPAAGQTWAEGQSWSEAWQRFQPLAATALAGGDATEFGRALTQNPMLASIDRMWNANPLHELVPIDWAGVAQALRLVWLRSLSDPGRLITRMAEFNMEAMRSATAVWNDAARRWWGAAPEPDAKPDAKDKRFAAPEWQANPAFRMLKELYLLASEALLDHNTAPLGADPAEQHRITFHLQQFVDAMSPSLMLFSNPVALRRAVETGGASLADGMRNLLRDMHDGRLSMVDATAFAPGRNLALSPGKVVYRNALVELIQYAPSTPAVHERPLLILPPWINKFYILDMQPKNSLVKHLADAGFTVFMVSWKNPDAAMEGITFEDYMRLGVLETSDVVREITSRPDLNVMGYCIGGTLLALTLAWLANKGDERFGAATFMVSLQDFSRVGDSAVFSDEPGVDLIEQQMLERGYLDSREMSNMFNLLRSNDLIWSNVVNNYLLGQKPPAFDLLYWNSDGTRMARAAHSWYLHNTYLENNLVKPGFITLDGEALDLGRIKVDTYAVGAEKDHIVPWAGAWRITQLFGGSVRYALASSGHIAGVINPPGGKGNYWVSEDPAPADSAEAWLQAATRHDGSWWADWFGWLGARSGEKVAPPRLGSPAHPATDDAPGRYVLEK